MKHQMKNTLASGIIAKALAISILCLGFSIDSLAQDPQADPCTPADSARTNRLILLRTNVLAVPFANVGIETCITPQISVGANWYYPWIWRNKIHKDCFEILALDLESKYWFRKPEDEANRMLGPAAGLYCAAGYYDFERNYSGHQGWFLNVGADYTHAFRFRNSGTRLELEFGLGFIWSPAQPYDCFEPEGKCYRRKGVTRQVRWFGPTRIGVSFSTPLFQKSSKRH